MQIGPFSLANTLVLAPMAGVTDRPFRALCRRLGAGLAVSEMVAANVIRQPNPRTRRLLDHQGEAGLVVAQILGHEPRAMAEAARVNLDQGAQIIDINMGCPAPKVCRAAAGSALLRDEAQVARILEAVVGAVAAPVTLKMRTGWDPQSRNGVRVARIAEQSGVQALAVHGRTRACGYTGPVDYASIRAIKQAVSIPVIANGDIDGPRKAAAVLRDTGADGLMIGRAALGRPWIFGAIGHYLTTGDRLPEPSARTIRDILLEHLEALYGFYGEFLGVRIARKHLAWYSQDRPGGAAFRTRVNPLASAHQQRLAAAAFFDQAADTRDELACD